MEEGLDEDGTRLTIGDRHNNLRQLRKNVYEQKYNGAGTLVFDQYRVLNDEN